MTLWYRRVFEARGAQVGRQYENYRAAALDVGVIYDNRHPTAMLTLVAPLIRATTEDW